MNLLDLEQYVTPYVTACPEPLLELALRQAVREFSEYTRDYRVVLSVPMLAATATYDLAVHAGLPVGAQFERIERVIGGDHLPITPFSKRGFDIIMPGWQVETGPSINHYTMDDSAGLMRVYPVPDADINETLSVTVSLKPTLSSTTILDSFANRHAEYFGYGAAGILMKMPGKPWTSPDAGAYYSGLFQERMSKVRVKNLYDHTTAPAFMSSTSLDDY